MAFTIVDRKCPSPDSPPLPPEQIEAGAKLASGGAAGSEGRQEGRVAASERTEKPASIHDVAGMAGVSITTVSHVLSGKRQVAEATAARVRMAVDRLGYVPASLVRSLQHGQTHVVALLVPNLHNDFYATLARGAEDGAHDRGYSLMLCSTSTDPEREQSYLDLVHTRFVDGLVYAAGSRPAPTQLEILRGRFPIVFADETFDDVAGVSSVAADHYAGGRLLGLHAREMGHRHAIVLAGPSDLVSSVERARGFEDGFQGEVRRLFGTFDIGSGRTLAEGLLTEDRTLGGATIVAAGNDLMAIGALEVLAQAGLRCPDDVSVVGFDDVRDARLVSPALTTVRQPAYEIGRRSIEVLLDEIATRRGHGHVAQAERFDVSLVVRTSTAPSAKAG